MRKRFILIILLFNSVIFAQYKIENGKIYYQEGKYQKKPVVRRVEDGQFYKHELPDLASFKIINSEYAIDKYTAYFQEYDIQDSDVKTFEILSNGIVKDKNYVYLYREKVRYETGKPINLKDFTLLEKDGTVSYLKDKNGIYEFGMYLEKLENVDINTFEVLNNGCGKDKSSVYHGNNKLENVDKETFECLEYGFARDKNGVYFPSIGISDKYEKIKGIDAETFEIIDEFFAKDKNNLYFLREKLENIEKNEIETVYVGKKYNVAYSIFFKNKNGVYKMILEDPFDFTKFKLTKLNIDKNNFEVLSRDYYKDKNNVYCNDKIMKEADVESFEVVGDEDREMVEFVDGLMKLFGEEIEQNGNITAKDKNNKYVNCEVVR